ncbi:alpha/beta hydrolase [Crossiella sp. NPDC003009]
MDAQHRTKNRTIGLALLSTVFLSLATTPALAQADPLTGQQLSWRPCFDPADPPPNPPANFERLECAEFQAPLDWHRPGHKKISIAVSRIRATGPAAGVLFTNPGGPGSPGRRLPLSLSRRTELADRFDLIGIDPRGTGASSPVRCGPPAAADQALPLDPRDRTPANLTAMQDQAERIIRDCQVFLGERAATTTTAQTARDLDLLRHLLGQRKINFLGISAGTWLATHYASLFPHRAGRFALDSAMDATGSWESTQATLPMAYERRFREGFLPWLAQRHATYGWGQTPAAAHARYEGLRARLATAPVNGINGAVLDAIILGGLGHAAAFPGLAGQLAALDKGQATPLAAPPGSDILNPDPASYGAVYTAIRCNDTPSRFTRASLVADSARLGQRYPLYGWAQVVNDCLGWQRPGLPVTRITGHGLPPMLIVQSEQDPKTPIEGARRLQQRLPGSRLLVVAGGDHGLYPGNPCVNTAVEAFLAHGTLPEGETRCP